MNLPQEMQNWPSRFYRKLLGYRLSPRLLSLVDTDPILDPLPRALTASQGLQVYDAFLTFGLTEVTFPQDRTHQKPAALIRFDLNSENTRPTYGRLDQVLTCKDPITREELYPKPQVLKDAHGFVKPGRIRIADSDRREELINQGIGPTTFIDFEFRSRNATSEQRAEALWVVAMRPLIYLARK